uniref:glycosyltransferase n=1 Tax=Bartonella sp. CL63NXGY TaxID=3243538 RepID=UPI0035CF0969
MYKGIIFVPFMTGKGGTETVIHNLFKAFDKNKIDMTVYSIGGSEDYEWTNGVKVKTQFISNNRKLRTLYYLTCLPFKIKKIIKDQQPDFVISTNPVMWLLDKRSIKSLHLNVPVIAWYHYSLSEKPIKPLFLQSADYFLAISSGIKNQLSQLNFPTNKVKLIFNPVDSDYKPISRPQRSIKFIYLGRIDYDKQKNVSELIKACQDLRGNWTLELYGDEAKGQRVKS